MTIVNNVNFKSKSSKQEECVSPNAARNQFNHPHSTPRTSQQTTQQRDVELPNAWNSIPVVGVVWSFHLNDHSQSYGTRKCGVMVGNKCFSAAATVGDEGVQTFYILKFLNNLNYLREQTWQ